MKKFNVLYSIKKFTRQMKSIKKFLKIRPKIKKVSQNKYFFLENQNK